LLETLSSRAHRSDVETAPAQEVAKQRGGVLVVIDDQDGSIHRICLFVG
jgi:hypothetical protein